MGDIWFFKRIDIGGGLDGGITVLEPQATLGGRDSETPESALAFLVARLPSSGALWVDRGGTDASGATWTRLEARHLASGAERVVLTTLDKLYWTAGPEIAGPPVSIGGSPVDTATLTDRWPTDRVTLTALSLNGAATTITTDSSGSFFQGGIGVSGAPPGTVMPSVEANEINAGVDGQDGTGERLRVAFRAPGGGVQLVGSAVVTVTSFFAHEGDEGRVDLFANGVLVKSLSFGAAAANPANNPDIVLSAANAVGAPGSGQYRFTITGVAFDQAEFSAVRSGLRDPSAAFDPGRGSDYYLQSITYVPVTTPVVDFDYLAEDERGARSATANVRIVSDPLSTLMLRIDDAGFVLEGHEAWFRLRLTDAAGNAVAATSATTITVAMLSGTATRGLDFQNGEAGTPSLYTVTIAAGFSDALLRVRTFGDDEEAAITGNSDFVLEGPETFHAEIVSAGSATHNFQLLDSRATATIAEGVIADPIRASVDWGTDFNWGGPAFARAISLNSRGSFEDVLDGAGVETDGGEWPIGFWPLGWDGHTVNPFALLVDAGGWDLINNAPAQQVRIASQPNIGTAFAGIFPYWQTNALIYYQMRYPVNGIRWTLAEDTDATGTGVNFVTLKQRGPDVWGGLPGSGVTIQAYDFAGSPTPYTVRWGNIQDAGILGVGDDRFITVGGANTAEEGSSERVAIGFGTLINRADFYFADFFLRSDNNRNGPMEYYSAVGLITLHRAGQQLGTWTFGMDPDAQYGTSERLPVERLIRPDIIMGYGTGYSGSYLRIEGIEFDRAEFAVQGWWTGEPTIYLSGWFPFNARYAIQSVQAMGGEVSFQYQAGIDRYGVTDWSAPVDVLLNRPLQNSYTPHTYGHSPQARVLEATTAEETSPIVFTIRLDNLTDAALLSQSAVRLRLDLTGNLTESDLGDMAAAGWTRIATDGGVYFQRDVILAAGQTQAQVPVPTVLDFLSEGAETARLRIVSAENLALGGLLIQDSLAYGRVTDGPRPFADDVATIAQLDAPNKIFWDASSQPASGAGRWMLSRSFELEQGSQGLGDVEGPIPDWGGWDAQGSEYGSMVWWKLTSQPAYGKVWSGQGLFGSFPSSGSAFTVIDVSTSWLDFDTREAWRPSWIVADKDTVLVQAAVTTAQGADAAGWAGVTLLAHGLGRSPLTNGVSFGADGVGVGSNGIEAGTGTATGETETLVALFDRVVGRAVIEIEGLAANELGRLQVYSGNGLLRDLTFGRAGSGANLILGDDNRLVLQNLIFDRLEFSAEALTGNAGQARITEGSSFLVKSIAYQSPQDVSFTYTTHDHPSGGNVSQPALVTIDVDGVAGTPDSAFAPLRLRVEPGRVFEGGSWHNPARFVLDSATPLNTNTTITYRWVNGTADRSDFWDGNASGPITVTLLAGQLSVTSEWGVFPIDDGVAEGDEFFGIEILSVTNFNRPIVVADRITEVTLSDRPQPVADAVLLTYAQAAPASLPGYDLSRGAPVAYRGFGIETGAAAIGDDDLSNPDLGAHNPTQPTEPVTFRLTALPTVNGLVSGALYLDSDPADDTNPWTQAVVGTNFTSAARLHWVATAADAHAANAIVSFSYAPVAFGFVGAAETVRIVNSTTPLPTLSLGLADNILYEPPATVWEMFRFALDGGISPVSTTITFSYEPGTGPGAATFPSDYGGTPSGVLTAVIPAGQSSAYGGALLFEKDGVLEGEEWVGIRILSVSNELGQVVVPNDAPRILLRDRPILTADAVAALVDTPPAELAALGYSGPAAVAYRSFGIESGATVIGDDDSATPDLGGFDAAYPSRPTEFRLTALPGVGKLYVDTAPNDPSNAWTLAAAGMTLTTAARLHWVGTEGDTVGAGATTSFRYVATNYGFDSAEATVRISGAGAAVAPSVTLANSIFYEPTANASGSAYGPWESFSFSLTGGVPAAAPTTITFQYVPGTAIARTGDWWNTNVDADYFWEGAFNTSYTVTIPAGQASVIAGYIAIRADGVVEGEETIGLRILSISDPDMVVPDGDLLLRLRDRPIPTADAVATQAEAAPADLAARGYSGPAAAAYRSFTVETGAAAIGDDDSATPDLGGHETTLPAVPPSFRITALPNHGTLYLESSVTAPATPWTAVAVGTAFTGSARLHWVATEEQMAGATGDAVFRYVSVAGPAESAAVEVRIAPPPSPAPMMMMSLVSMDDGVVDLSALAEEGPFAPFGTSEETPEGGEDGPLSGGSLAQQPALLDGEADLSGILDTPEQSVMLDLPSTSASDPTAPPGSPVDQAPWIEPVAPPVVVEPEYPPPGVPPE